MNNYKVSKEIINCLNYRIEQEEYSSRIYLAMSNWLDKNGYTGAAKLFKRYSTEELTHAGWAYQYLLDLDIQPVTPSIDQPENNYRSLKEIITLAYEHEVEVTNQCQELAQCALDNVDFMTLALAQKYLSEQTEELAKSKAWVDRIEAFGDDKIALRLLDNEMGEEA